MGKGYVAIWGGGGLPFVGGVGSLMTHSAGFVTTQSIAFKYVMASVPSRYTMAGLLNITLYFFKTLIALKVKCFELYLNYH
jgi:hypothetical protein